MATRQAQRDQTKLQSSKAAKRLACKRREVLVRQADARSRVQACRACQLLREATQRLLVPVDELGAHGGVELARRVDELKLVRQPGLRLLLLGEPLRALGNPTAGTPRLWSVERTHAPAAVWAP